MWCSLQKVLLVDSCWWFLPLNLRASYSMNSNSFFVTYLFVLGAAGSVDIHCTVSKIFMSISYFKTVMILTVHYIANEPISPWFWEPKIKATFMSLFWNHVVIPFILLRDIHVGRNMWIKVVIDKQKFSFLFVLLDYLSLNSSKTSIL